MTTRCDHHAEIRDLENKIAELRGTTELLLAFRLISDGHSPDLKDAMWRVRHERGIVLDLYR